MKNFKSRIAVALLGAALGFSTSPAMAADGIIFKAEVSPGYCHMQYPALVENFDNPVLQDSGSLDIIDFYGPCDHDPLGKDAVQNHIVDTWIQPDSGDEG